MKVTKYEQACLDISYRDHHLIIDPGVFSKSLPKVENVAGIIITHVHQDHMDEELIKKIKADNPKAIVFAPPQAAEALSEIEAEVIDKDTNHLIEGFTINFYMTDHEPIHRSFPHTQNLAIRINEKLYYPGDSFSIPKDSTEVVAIPTSGPWLRLSDVIDFLHGIKPKKVFPTHDALISEIGEQIHHSMLKEAGNKIATEWLDLAVGDSLEI
jgi:L-ascorbate metabolism protein UlaG (beta-lactamase superfamily)